MTVPVSLDADTLNDLDLSYFDVAVMSSFYQFSIYVMIRLSHGGFTLGEVGLVGLGTTVLFMETVNLTIAKVSLISFRFIPQP